MADSNTTRRRRHHPTGRSHSSRHSRGRGHSRWQEDAHCEGSPGRRPDASSLPDLETALLTVVDAAVAGCILVVPFLMGGRHPIGQLALVCLASVAAVAWAVRQAITDRGFWRPTYASLLLLTGLLLVGFQLVPLPHAWFARLSPRAAELLPLWAPEAEAMAGLGVWTQISLVPQETRAAWILLASYCLLFLVTVQRVERVEDIERILRHCALAAVAMAGFGLIQYFTTNGKFFWFYEAPYSSTAAYMNGSFTNRNHFAHFLALGMGPLVWWICRAAASHGESRWSLHGRSHASAGAGRLLLPLAAAMVVFASLLSLSRGGNLALLLAALIVAAACSRALAAQARLLWACVAAGTLVIVALNLVGYQRVSDRLSDLSSGSIERLDRQAGRRRVWQAVAEAIPDFRWFGSGVGSHREVCPIYLEDPGDGVVFTHAENGPLQESLETGFAGAALLAAGSGFCGFWCVAGMRRGRSSRLRACLGAIGASLAASLAHSMVDFVWYVPACTAMVAVLAALACRAWQLGRPADAAARPWPVPRSVALGAAACIALVAVPMIGSRFRATVAQHYWDRVCRTECEDSRRPAGERDVNVPENRRRQIEMETRLLDDLAQVIRWYPEHTQAHLTMARCHLHLFDLLQMTSPNPMPLPQVRDAAMASADQFPSRQARDEWMQRAFGDHCGHLHEALRHTRAALRRCPLQGQGYLYLAELCFLDGATAEAKRAYVDQALRVRPHDANVLDMAAREMYEAILAGDGESWLQWTRKAVQSSPACTRRIIEDLVVNTPPEGAGDMIEFIVTQLQPDFEGLTILYQASKDRAEAEQLRPLAQYYAATAEFEAKKADGPAAARLWMGAAGARADLGQTAESLRCARQAHASDPGNVAARYRLACLELEMGNREEARAHLLQCVRRSPHNNAFQQKYREAIRGDARRPATTVPLPSGATH